MTNGICGIENLWNALSGRINLYGQFPSEGVALGYGGYAPLARQRGLRRPSRKSVRNLHAVAASAVLQSFQKERSLRFRLGEFKRFAELFGSSCMILHPHLELTDDGIE